MRNQVTAVLKDHIRQELETDGVTCVRQVLTGDQVSSLRKDINACVADDKQFILDYGSKRKLINGFFLWRRSDNLRRLACDSSLPMLAAQLMRSKKVNLFIDLVFIKEPGTPNHPSPWHSDLPLSIVNGRQYVTFWIALDCVTRESGAVQFIRGSHLWDQSRLGYYRIGREYEANSDIDNKRDMYDIVHYDLEPGDMTVHHGMTLHSAFGNHTSDRRRRGYAIRYTGDDALYEPNPYFETPVPLQIAPGAPLDSPLFPVAFRSDY
jgi:ectoine hydroxylase-related dioxygenase (phytanoyl-CoA dioxygenase family)